MKSTLTWIFAGLVGIVVVGLFTYQRHYIRHHLPLMRAGRAAAEQQGPAMLEEIGTPAGAKLQSPVAQKPVFDEVSSMWGDEPIGVEWTSLWDAPGDHPQIDAWYKEKLLATGWQAFQHRVPSSVQTEFWKDKWLVTIEHQGTFANEHPPHARFRLRLTWDYWHNLGRPPDAF